ncbi:MAG: class I SAM-dependent rRNA methyltransferase [Mucilaginibacter polytrichastri]|nr:class I SAM-dependent rRNA methyltransferase [Mucilaginibacter polytrichastri]
MKAISLRKGKDKAVRQRHPWVFSGAVNDIKDRPENGEIVRVLDEKGVFLAYGTFNAQSRVAVRLLEWDESQIIDGAWWTKKITQAVQARQPILHGENNTCRLIFSEADFLPGLIVDQYAGYLSVQILTAGIERAKEQILDILEELVKPEGIFERSDAGARSHEGLAPSSGLLRGKTPPEFVDVIENGVHYQVNISEGQKSGFYCDQRDNRFHTAKYAKDKRVLDCFCYSGGFTLNALRAGAASVTSVDSSALALETLKRNMEANRFHPEKSDVIQNDVNRQLRAFREEGRSFDLIVLDPPKYAPSRSALDKAARAYKDLNRQAMLLLSPGGLLATFSCSGAVDIATLKQILAWAALDAGREVQFIEQLGQPADHPVRSSFPEGEYLKGLICLVR